MITRIQRYFGERRKVRHAIDRAVTCFEQTRHKKKALRDQCVVIYSDAEKSVVRVCYGGATTPYRAYFEVWPDGRVVEMSFQIAQMYGEQRWH